MVAGSLWQTHPETRYQLCNNPSANDHRDWVDDRRSGTALIQREVAIAVGLTGSGHLRTGSQILSLDFFASSTSKMDIGLF
jgi:hypothetical protein